LGAVAVLVDNRFNTLAGAVGVQHAIGRRNVQFLADLDKVGVVLQHAVVEPQNAFGLDAKALGNRKQRIALGDGIGLNIGACPAGDHRVGLGLAVNAQVER